MDFTKKLALAGLVILGLYTLKTQNLFEFKIEKPKIQQEESVKQQRKDRPSAAGREENLTKQPESSQQDVPALQENNGASSEDAGPEETIIEDPQPLRSFMETSWDEEILETNIEGGLSIKNATSYDVDASAILSQGPAVRLPAEGPQILIIHTHGSEAYTQAGLDHYEANDDHRTEDKEFNIIRIGDELTSIFEQAGLRVIHDREIYDYPSYTGSYNRSGAAVEAYLQQYPNIAVVLDVHRDALGANGVVYKTMAEEEGVCASQVMLLSGSDDSGLNHPHWRDNLALALYLQNAVSAKHPSLMRPVSLVRERYNQQLTRGSLIIEVGSSGNTLQEALAAIRLFGEAAAQALKELAE